MYDIIVLGSGPAGLTAALYAARGGKKTLILGGDQLGGQMATIHSLENYPGTPAVNGLELANTMLQQATGFGAEIKYESAIRITSHTSHLTIESNTGSYETKSVIIATGAKPRPLNIDGAREFTGRGVSYCATCDGFFYSGKDVAVYGGGNSALNDALYLANLARKVYIIYRKSSFTRAEQILIDRVNAAENIECIFDTEITAVIGNNNGVNGIRISNLESPIPLDALFVAIGHEANTDYLSEEIIRDAAGRLIQNELPAGIFVAGDVQSGLVMQVATAVGAGCDAGIRAIAYVNKQVNGKD